jgi:hypothetical protein
VFFQQRAGRSVWYDRRVRNAEAAGSNPARSTNFKASNAVSPLNSNPFQQNNREIVVNPRMLEEFEEFMHVNMRLEARTVSDTREHIRPHNPERRTMAVATNTLMNRQSIHDQNF